MGNTVGSRINTSKASDWAYIAGFFDGDGSLMIQIKNRHKTKRGWRIMFTICFYQDIRHKEPLLWMQKIFGIGYLHDRNDGITELRINGYNQVQQILKELKPYIKFKKKQVTISLKMLELLKEKPFLSLSHYQKNKLADWFNQVRNANYKSTNRKFSATQIKQLLTNT